MRCTNCGLPLSPSRMAANCPRCGAATGIHSKSGATVRQQDFDQRGWNNVPGDASTGGMLQESPWNPGSAAQYTPYSPAQQPPAMSGNSGNWPGPPTASPQMQQEMWEGTLPDQRWNTGSNIQYSYPQIPPPLAGTTGWQAGQGQRISKKNNTRLGFTVASLCVITGGLLLVFVYFLASGLLNNPGSAGSSISPNSVVSPTSLPPSPAPTNTPSPTAVPFPGQQYIDHAQMTGAIDAKTEKPTQLTTTFKVNAKIYVTFQLHPPGQSGAVCLSWYLNGKQVTTYQFAVGRYSSASYSYAIYGNAGPGTVEIYWASSTSCADEQLAQRLDFTVTM